ncbi:MAG: energy-coupled thiamine transporter ThiT [Clostridiaceae bacterium]|nr:energy-coupled thiamine transporter ThiT [Clostridiaceae bacterium]MBW4858689.1 energy-coupled thiamine transporter ThiT [Clostridiaceae bacterium]MBW4868148.1 energy-coupled thiamine transporter ThiT [Clostridiaceae bacterium]
MKRKWSTRMLAEGGVMIALSILLSYIKVYQAPQGGSVTAGSMIPIMFFAMRWGVGPGVFVGAIYGILHFILKPYFYHPIQFLLDYPIAYGFLGLAGIATMKNGKTSGKDYFMIFLGVLLSIGGRFISHLLSGVIFFAEYAGDQNPWLYSIVYNAGYLVPELIISVIILLLLWKPLSRIEK